MIPPKSRLIAMTLAAAAGCSSHGTEKSRDEAVDGALEESECPATVARSTDWLVFGSNGSFATFTLPPGTVEAEALEGQNWRLPGGSFAYRLSPLVDNSHGIKRPAPWCVIEVAGRRVEVRYFYGDATFGRRGYLTAEIPLSRDTIMEIIASTYDSSGVDTLIAVLRGLTLQVP
mgnify:CR=1|jgi:hypothetical protein